jgi:hypothetical protein
MSDKRNVGVFAFRAAAEEIFQAAERLRSAAEASGRERLISVARMVWEAARLARWLGAVVATQYPPERVEAVLPIQSVVLPKLPVETVASASPGSPVVFLRYPPAESPGSVTTTVGDRGDDEL